MQGPKRRVIQAVSYEAIAMLVVAPGLAWFFEQGIGESALMAIVLAGLAMTWNLVFNQLFERWEASRSDTRRTWKRRVLHALGFEGGLTLALVPIMAWLMNCTLWQALVGDLGLIAFFMVYTLVFQWCFDHLFGLPRLKASQSDFCVD